MSAQLSIFDLASGLAARDAGILQVISNNECFVQTMRGIARLIARRKGVVNSDDLRQIANEYGIVPNTDKVWGGIFKGAEWICVGQTHSEIPSNHGRMIRSYSLRERIN